MRIKIRIQMMLLLLLALAAAGFAYSDAELRYASDGTIASQSFDTISASYGDQGKDIILTIYSSSPSELQNKYVGLLYSDKQLNNYALISPDPAGKLFPIGYPDYEIESNNHISTNIELSTSDAVYPGIVYAVVSSDNTISQDDALIQISPEKSWLIGADGGLPCMPVGSQWVIEGNELCPSISTISEEYQCPCSEDDADPDYDSFDISAQVEGTDIKISVLNAYWKNNDGYAVEITKDMDRIVAETRDKSTGEFLDSAITSLNDEITLSSGNSENIAIYINGIKTSETEVDQPAQPGESTGGSGGGGAGGGSSASSESSTEQQTQPAGNNVLTFTFDDLSIMEAKVYLKEPVNDASLSLKKSIWNVAGAVYERISTRTNIEEEKINSVFIKFRVPLAWLSENNLNREQVNLYYDSGSGWQPVQTTITSEDVDYVYYLATLNILEDFAVGDTTKIAREESPSPEFEPTLPGLVSDSQPQAQDTVSFREKSVAFITGLLILAVLSLIAIIIKIKKK